MWTNVFKIGSLQQISWFQFLPYDPDLNPLPDKSARVDQKDAAMLLVLSSHLQLQKERFLSAWTNSFVGPWDPSQGVHNPDEKLKLWLFLPGRHSSIPETAQAAVSPLRVVASGLWVAPGDSEEIAAALSQSFRNCIERALAGLSYMRYGDVFSKYHPSQSEELFRRGQPAIEFIFAATEEAVYVHAVISAKHIRPISSSDMEKVLKRSSRNADYKIPVIVSPHGMRGRLTGCCPGDLVNQVYFSSGKLRTSNGFIGLPQYLSQSSGCQLRGQNCYAEVTLGCPRAEGQKASQSGLNSGRNLPKHHVAESPVVGAGGLRGLRDQLSVYERTFIYPAEAVLVPVLQTSFARSSLKRFWLQHWIGPSLPGSTFFMNCGGKIDSMDGSWTGTDEVRMHHGCNSSSNSNNSSISSISCSSSDSDYKIGCGELEADADSLENDIHKLGSKRPRTGMTESFAQVGNATNAHKRDPYKSDFGSMEVNTSAITGVGNENVGSHWDWDDDDRGMGMDIQSLLSEFGDFGDFFENDVLPFGEPPGTAESHALMFSPPDCGDVGSSPLGVMDVSDQMLIPAGFPSFESFNPPPAPIDECLSKNLEVANNDISSGPVNHTRKSSSGEFEHLIKAEALMTFAPEYGAVETPPSDLSSSIFGSPYKPKCIKSEKSNPNLTNYIYGPAPPASPCFDGSDENSGLTVNSKACSGRHEKSSALQAKKYYSHVENGNDRRPSTCNNSIITSEGVGTTLASYNSSNAAQSIPKKKNESAFGIEQLLLSMKNVLATEVECIMFQASMCKIRHTLLSSSSPAPIGVGRLSGSMVLNQLPGDPSIMTDMSNKYEVRKKETIPVRIAGDIDGGIPDGHLHAPVGVWRTVGLPKVSKPTSSPGIEVSPTLPHSSFSEEGLLSYVQRQPLQELLDGMALLVQQATSFVDVALDADCGDGPYGWLALQEQWRREFSCGPSMVHAGCGGFLASCHSLDIAGAELVDPLSADVHASSVISLLQSDVKTALKSAFDALDGPLSVTDWCKGRVQPGDVGASSDGYSAESIGSDSFTIGNVSSASDGAKVDETGQRRSTREIGGSESEQQPCSQLRPTLSVLPFPSILVGYQDDWLKVSANSLQLWEKAPLEPYAFQKPMTYNVICPDIDPLTSAATDFFQQLGTVYETCKLGTHSPQVSGNQMEIDSGKLSCSGFILLDCPQSMRVESNNASLVGSISDYFLSISNGWDLTSYLKSLSRTLKGLKLGSYVSTNPKEGITSPCMVIYVVCPFPESTAILQTVIESSVAIGSVLSSDVEKRSMLHSQVGKALSCSAAVDEASISNVITLPGFSVPRLVLQIVTVDAIFRVTNPALNELIILKEIAFTVYNKGRRIARGLSNDVVQSSSLSGRSHSVLNQMTSHIPGSWKDCVGIRMTGPTLPREGDIDASLRPGTWDNSWQSSRTGGLSCDPKRAGEYYIQDEIRYMFEPLFILAEPGSLEHGVSPAVFNNLTLESSRQLSDDSSGGFMQSSSMDTTGSHSQLDGSEHDGLASSHQKSPPSLHCCYGWTEDWRWLVCIWTDSRGELLDTQIFPFGGFSSRQDTKGLQCLFVQVLQQGCQILQMCSSPDTGVAKPRDFVIARIGHFFELEYQEWQKAIYSVGGSEVKKWPLQLRRSVPDGVAGSSNGTTLEQQERNLPSSPSPLYSPHSKASGFMKGGLGQAAARKQLIGGMVDSSRGILQWVQSICFIAVSYDHTLSLVFQADSPSTGGNNSGYLEGFTPVRSLGSTPASYIIIPSPSMRFLPPTPLQLPTCLTAESPPLAHLLHSKGSAIPLSTGFVVSKAVPTMRKDNRSVLKEEWPSVLSVSLIDYYGQEKNVSKRTCSEVKDMEIETHLILESVAAELHALSWMTVSPAYLERRTALPLHCDMVLRLRRLIHLADRELSRPPGKSKV